MNLVSSRHRRRRPTPNWLVTLQILCILSGLIHADHRIPRKKYKSVYPPPASPSTPLHREDEEDSKFVKAWDRIVEYVGSLGAEWIVRDIIGLITSRNNVLRVINGITGGVGVAAIQAEKLSYQSKIDGNMEESQILYRIAQALGLVVGLCYAVFDPAELVVTTICYFTGIQSYYCGRYRLLDFISAVLYMIGHIIIWSYPPSGKYLAIIEANFTAITFALTTKYDWTQGVTARSIFSL